MSHGILTLLSKYAIWLRNASNSYTVSLQGITLLKVFIHSILGSMCFTNLYPNICAGDEVGTSLNTEAPVQKYYTEEMFGKFWKIYKNISVVEC